MKGFQALARRLWEWNSPCLYQKELEFEFTIPIDIVA